MSLGNSDGTTVEESGSPRLSQRGTLVTLRARKEKGALIAHPLHTSPTFARGAWAICDLRFCSAAGCHRLKYQGTPVTVAALNLGRFAQPLLTRYDVTYSLSGTALGDDFDLVRKGGR